MSISTAPFGGKTSPKQTIIDALELSEDVDVEIAVVVVLTKENKIVSTGWSDGSLLKRLGMLEMAKHQMIQASDESYEYECGYDN